MTEANPAGHLTDAEPHGLLEDGYALFVGSILLALGLVLLQRAGLVTGGVAGIALIFSYLTGQPIGFYIIGLTVPALVLGLRAMGRAFALKTLLSNFCLVGMTWLAPSLIGISTIDRVAAAIAGGSVIGMGALALARHEAATGGSGVLILWLYRTRGWNAGRTQFVIDGLVLFGSLVVISPQSVALSAIGLVATAGILYVWHRPGRYMGY